MKKLILVLVLSSYSFSLFCQGDFAPIGAKWYFRSTVGTSEVIDFIFSNSIKDTILQEQVCRLIKTEYYKFDKTLTNRDSLYVYEKNDSVFYFNTYYDKFVPLYNFTAEAGDTLTFLAPQPIVNESDSFRIIIDSVKTITINDVPLKHFYINGIESDVWNFEFEGGILIQGIGSLYSIFLPEPGISVALPQPILGCYQNEEQGLVHFSNSTPCIFDIIYSVDDLTELSAKVSISPILQQDNYISK